MANYTSITDEQVHGIAAAYYQSRALKTQVQDLPKAVLIAGQPGAGKSQIAQLVRRTLKTQGGYIHVDADRMREELPTHGTTPTSQETQSDAGRLVGALRHMAISNRRNIIEEGTFRDADMAERLIVGIKAQNYQVHMVIVATPPEYSLLGIYSRYEEQLKIQSPNPRLVPETYHNQAVLSFEKTLTQTAHLLDHIQMMDRSETLLFDSQIHTNTSVLEALAAGRKLTSEKLIQIADKWQKIISEASKRNAPVDYLDTLKAHHAHIHMLQRDACA